MIIENFLGTLYLFLLLVLKNVCVCLPSVDVACVDSGKKGKIVYVEL